MLEGIIEEGEEHVELAGDLLRGLGERCELVGEALHRLESDRARLGAVDRLEGFLGVVVEALGERVENVLGRMDPAALLARRGEHITQRAPEPECPVADREHGGGQPAVAHRAQDLGPALGRFAYDRQ